MLGSSAAKEAATGRRRKRRRSRSCRGIIGRKAAAASRIPRNQEEAASMSTRIVDAEQAAQSLLLRLRNRSTARFTPVCSPTPEPSCMLDSLELAATRTSAKLLAAPRPCRSDASMAERQSRSSCCPPSRSAEHKSIAFTPR
eukprot:745698-Hanusia_phi.AAC.2